MGKNAARRAEITPLWPTKFLPSAYGGTLEKLELVWPPPSEAELTRYRAERHLIKPEYPRSAAAPSEMEGPDVEEVKQSNGRELWTTGSGTLDKDPTGRVPATPVSGTEVIEIENVGIGRCLHCIC